MNAELRLGISHCLAVRRPSEENGLKRLKTFVLSDIDVFW